MEETERSYENQSQGRKETERDGRGARRPDDGGGGVRREGREGALLLPWTLPATAPSLTLHPATPRTGGAPLVCGPRWPGPVLQVWLPAPSPPRLLRGAPRGKHGPRACPADLAAG